jgi:hypothetical protein
MLISRDTADAAAGREADAIRVKGAKKSLALIFPLVQAFQDGEPGFLGV